MVFAWHVPVFFFISGWLWKPRRMGDEFAARSRSLLKPYLFWLIALYAAYLGVLVASGRTTFGRLLAPIYGGSYATQPFTTFWFVFVLFAAAILWQALARVPSWARGIMLAVALGVSVYLGPQLAATPLAIGTALPALLFVAAGAWLRRLESRRWVPWAAGVVGVTAWCLVLTGLVPPLDIKRGDWGHPLVSVIVAVAISWALVVVAQVLCQRLSARVGSAVTGFAVCGFTIVLAHPAVLWALSAWTETALFVAAIALPAAVARVALGSPVAQWVTGVPRLAPPKSRG